MTHALLLAALILSGAARGTPSPAALERQFRTELEQGHVAQASALADSLVRRRERTEALPAARAAQVLDSLGLQLFRLGTPEAMSAAEPLFRGALARRERAFGADSPEVASSLATLSTLLDYQGRWSEAVPLATRAADIRLRSLGERDPATANSLRQLGSLHLQLGDVAAAEPPLEHSVRIYAQLGPKYAGRLADGYNNLGELARVEGRIDSAEARFRAGLAIARARLGEGDPVRWALTNNLAGLYKDVGRYDEAEPLLATALATFEASGGDAASRSTAQLNLAEVRRLQGRYEAAEPLYRDALAGARSALGPDHPDLVFYLNQAAVNAQALHRNARADSLFREAGTIVEKTLGTDHPMMAQNLQDRGRLSLESGSASGAESLLARALAIRESRLGASHPDVGLTLVDQARARLVADPAASSAGALLGRALAILDSTRAYPESRLDAYALRAEWEAHRGQRKEAISDMRVALAAIDSLRLWRGGGDETRAGFVAQQLARYDELMTWQLDAGDVAGAFETHERGRARVLLDQIASSGVDVRAGIPPEILAPLAAAEHSAEGALAAAQRAIQDAEADPVLSASERLVSVSRLGVTRDSAAIELALARRRIEDASPLWRGVLSAEGRTPPAGEIQRDLVTAGRTLLVYHVGVAASRLFVIPHSGRPTALALKLDDADAHVLGVPAGELSEAKLERIVTGRRTSSFPDSAIGIAELLSGTRSGGYVELSLRSREGPDSCELRLHALWNALVPTSVRPALRSSRVVVLVPDGALHLIAFEALVTRVREGRSGTRYWLDDAPAIVYGPSATSLLALERRGRNASASDAARPEVVSVTNVAFDRPGSAASSTVRATSGRTWAPLPGSKLETEAIRAAFGDDRVRVIEGAAAREPAVRAALPGRRFLHLATHGFVDDSGRNLLAGLVLAPPDSIASADDDGLLELFEIHRLPLDCELAVLSACETARGPRVAGEGTFALSRGFLAAGARRVVASLWPVEDRSSGELVGELFRRIASAEKHGSSLDDAIALRDAKKKLRADPKWADPFYWAGFVISGL